jgi:hypothetical protein
MTKREKLVYAYMVALSRLYGVLEWKQFIKVFNQYNLPKITKTEINNTPYYWNKREDYCRLYGNVLVYSRVDEGLIGEAMYQAEGKDYYMPTEEEILALSKPKEYMQQSAAHTALYAAIKDILIDNPAASICVDEMHKTMCVTLGVMLSAGEKQQIIFDVLGEFGLNPIDMDGAQKILDLLTNAWNNTRMWANRGYTPNEFALKTPKEKPTEPKLLPKMTAKASDIKNEFAVQFYTLWYKLIYWINGTYKIVPSFPVPIYGQKVDGQPFIEIRKRLWDNPRYIDAFLSGSSARDLNDAQRQAVGDWGKKFVKGTFLVHKHLADYSVFQALAQNGVGDKLYGVCGITDSISDMLGENAVPLLVDAVLLPFNGRIVYDTFIAPYSISFTGDTKKSFAQLYKEAYGKSGIVTTL